MDRVSTDLDPSDVFEELCELRADFAIRHAFDGFDVDYEDALEIIRSKEDLTEEQKAQRDILIAAVTNLIDFATAEEYQSISEIEDVWDEAEIDEEEELDEDEMLELALPVFTKYNQRYANTENMDIEYAMIVAAQIAAVSESSTLMYMTMGDERVRPWHLQYEGFTAPKSSFPAWLIPPIEHQCRCYLVEDGKPAAHISDVQSALHMEPPYWFNPTFKESVALGGRIFSDEHPYFQIDEEHNHRLTAIANKIKNKYLHGNNIQAND